MSLRALNDHIIARGIDLLLDPRLPHALPYNMWRRWRYAPPTALPRLEAPLCICLTFDIEHDYRDPASAEAASRFLAWYIGWAGARAWRSTLYIQGDLVPVLSTFIHEAEDGHEIGLHGFHHEVWGRSRWWQYRLGFVGISETEKHERLLQALEMFDRACLDRPRSFRAPYLNADRKTLELLAQHGFTSDSSPATYLGAVPVPRQRHGVWQVPVTANPRPVWDTYLARYPELTMGNLVHMSPEQLMTTIAMALHLQLESGMKLPPHLVLLAHPWEFEPTPGVPYASTANWDHLDHVARIIADMYPAMFVTMSELVAQQQRYLN
jgi:peptidoglycan/xylan/chitin deacetylase (PgdA/CDA1 family)